MVSVPAANDFSLVLSGSNSTKTTLAASINPSNANYIFNQLGDSPNNSKSGVVTYAGTPGYTFINFKTLQTSLLAGDAGTGSLAGYGTIGATSSIQMITQSAVDVVYSGLTDATEGYSYASTPFITSQFVDGTSTKQLFKFHTIAHGTETNTEFKISISNLREPLNIDNEEQYSSFSVSIRKYSDKDKSVSLLEQYNNITLDPDSPNYISRVIGDRYPQYNSTLDKVELLGDFSNISDYIRVEVADAVDSKATSPKLSPKGFAAVSNPISTASLSINCTFPSSSFEGSQEVGGKKKKKGYLNRFISKIAHIKPQPKSAPALVD
jgi:hypothetical protein